jgi:hypothetical protein
MAAVISADSNYEAFFQSGGRSGACFTLLSAISEATRAMKKNPTRNKQVIIKAVKHGKDESAWPIACVVRQQKRFRIKQ